MKYILTPFLLLYIFAALSVNALAGNSTVEFRLASNEETTNSILYKFNNKSIYIEPEVILDFRHIEKAELDVQKHNPPTWLKASDQSGNAILIDKPFIMINIFLTEKGRNILKNVTAQNVGKKLALFIEGKLILAPKIIEPISSGHISVGGDFKEREAKEIVEKINKNKT